MSLYYILLYYISIYYILLYYTLLYFIIYIIILVIDTLASTWTSNSADSRAIAVLHLQKQFSTDIMRQFY